MPLTRPKSAQVNFDVTNISDPLIRLNSDETGSADKDAGIVIERGDDTNVAILYDESADTFAVVNTSETGTTSGNVTIASYADLKANDITVTDDLMVGDYIWHTVDNKSTYYGVDSDVRLTHDHNRGLILKQRQTTADTPAILTLQSTESSITVGERLGVIDFQTPDESSGTDAILVAAGIEAVAEGTFAADNNATKLSFKTAASETAVEKASLSSAGLFTATTIDATVLTGDLPAIDGSNLTGVASSYTHPNHSGDVVSSGDGALTIQTDAVDIAMLSASGTASSTTFLRGDNSWVTPTDTDTNTTYSSSDFSLSGLSGTTISSSDPTATSNPSAVGHLWLNSSSGESFVCTDATSNSNDWYNIGEGSGGVVGTYNVDFLVVAGGAGAGGCLSGGGGGGGYRSSYNSETSGGGASSETVKSVSPDTQYTVTVGGGGSGNTSSDGGDNGSNSIFSSITSIGGGGGGGDSASPAGDCKSGGSGGGAGQGGNSTNTGAAGTSGQGYRGGHTTTNQRSAGGGGASEVGENNQSGRGGHGGDGQTSTINGSTVRAGGGGGGGYHGAPGGDGGSGGGGGGATGGAGTGTSASSNTGGAGGGGSGGGGDGGNGGSGVVILRMATSDYSGTTSGSPTVTTSGSDTILLYNSSGTYTA